MKKENWHFTSNCTTEQVINLWQELTKCMYDKNSYGGNTCEIYKYRFNIHSPGEAVNSTFNQEDIIKRCYIAGHNILQIARLFQYKHNKDHGYEKELTIKVSNDESEWYNIWDIEEWSVSHRTYVKIN